MNIVGRRYLGVCSNKNVLKPQKTFPYFNVYIKPYFQIDPSRQHIYAQKSCKVSRIAIVKLQIKAILFPYSNSRSCSHKHVDKLFCER